MLKFINNEESPLYFTLSEFEDGSNDKNPQEEHAEICHKDKIETSCKINCKIELPQDKIMLDLKNPIDKNAEGTLISENAVDKRSKEELMEYCTNKDDVKFMYKIVSNNAVMKFPVFIN